MKPERRLSGPRLVAEEQMIMEWYGDGDEDKEEVAIYSATT
jgi:hypothetical protein